MSRTVRRTGKNFDPTQEECWITEDDRIRIEGTWNWLTLPRTFKTGKDYRKGWWQFHSDTYRCHRNNKWEWDQVRNKNQRDLEAWIKNDDHEPIFFEEINKRDWN